MESLKSVTGGSGALREESFEVGRQIMERVVRDNPDVFGPLGGSEQAPEPQAGDEGRQSPMSNNPAAGHGPRGEAPDVGGPIAPPRRSAVHWRRGFRRLGVVLAVALSALLGLLLWLIDLGVVVLWLLGFAAVVWGVIRAVRWVLAGFRADSGNTVDPRGPKRK